MIRKYNKISADKIIEKKTLSDKKVYLNLLSFIYAFFFFFNQQKIYKNKIILLIRDK